MSRQDQVRVSLTVNNTDYGVWDTMSGGEVDSEEVTWRAGGLSKRVSLGGPQEVGTITLTRLYDLTRDHTRIHDLINGAGNARAVVTVQPLDANANAFGKPLVYPGTLKKVQPPERDSNSSDVAEIEIEVTPDGTIG